jgi:beta-lactamase regulating signal transducer with metallopeptidase domain
MSRLAFMNLLLGDAAALIVVKATLVLALAIAVATAAKGLSAARRHLLWLAALSSCVWLALSSALVPATVIHTRLVAPKVVTASSLPPAVAPGSAPSTGVANASDRSAASAPTDSVRPSPTRPTPVSRHLVIAAWIIGCLALLLRHASGLAGTMRVAHRAFSADDDATRELARLAADAGVNRAVRLAYSASVHTPVVFGVVSPCVLFPTDAKGWSDARRRSVCLHEIAHVARGDWLSQMVGQFACTLFWFHPLVWLAFARLRAEAERAADDVVLRSGLPALEYATHLLELARHTIATRYEVAAVGIVSRSDLEQRFVALIDVKRSRAGLTRRARAVTAVVALAIVGPAASLRVGAPLQLSDPTVRLASPARASVRESVEASPADVGGAARATPSPEMHAATGVPVPPRFSRMSVAAAAERPASSPVTRPDFSGVWTTDTTNGPTTDSFVILAIKQSADSISFESRGHVEAAPTRGSFHNITFDGAKSTGLTITADRGLKVTASATWVADTLVLTTYAVGYTPAGIHDLRGVERLTLSADGNSLVDAVLSIPDGRIPPDGPRTVVLRRAAR